MKYIIDIPEQIAEASADYMKKVGMSIEPYTEPDLNITKENPVHLCDSCKRVDSIEQCPIKKNDILCGEDGEGGKGICCCKAYIPETTARKVVENEVWEFVNKLSCMNHEEIGDCFGMGHEFESDVLSCLTYSKAKSKYEAWMADKKQKETSELEEVTALANRIGIHRLYSLVKEIRGE